MRIANRMRISAILTLLAVGMLSACGGGSTTRTNNPPVFSVSVSPASALMDQGATTQFSARVFGNSNQAVVWSIQEAGGGSISQSGLYTAPAAAMVATKFLRSMRMLLWREYTPKRTGRAGRGTVLA